MEYVGRDRGRIVIARIDAEHRLVMLAREQDLVILVGRQSFGGEQRERRHVARVRRWRRMRDLLALEIAELLIRTVRLDDDDQVIALKFLRRALDAERHRAGDVDGERRRPGRETTHVQTTGAHRFDLRGVVLHLVENDLLAQALRQMRRERLEDGFIHSGIFDRRVGEHDRARVLPLFLILGRIGDHVLVLVAIHRVELAAVFAVVGSERGARRQRHNGDWREADARGAGHAQQPQHSRNQSIEFH